MTDLIYLEPGDPRAAWGASGLAEAFNVAAVIAPGDVHSASRLAGLFGESDERVVLAAALALRGTRLGHVCIDLATIRETVVVDGVSSDLVDSLPWPSSDWIDVVAASPMTGTGEPDRPLVLDGSLLYTQRMWEYQTRVADLLLARAAVSADIRPVLGEVLDRVFAGQVSLQVVAAAMSLTGRLTVVAGGPGTGKTYTIARIIGGALELAAAAGERPPHIALAAPTGKAAARLTEQLHAFAESGVLTSGVATFVGQMEASTIHRLLRSLPGRGGFRHDASSPLSHDLVVLDEMSMVSLPMAARVLDATRPNSRVVLVGDPDQLVSIEAGTVLADMVGEARDELTLSNEGRLRLDALVPGVVPPDPDAPVRPGIADHVITLDRVFRFGESSPVADVADAIRRGDADRVIEQLAAGREGLTWIDPGETAVVQIPEVVEPVIAHAHRLIELAQAGELAAALEQLTEMALLCAHRHGPVGVSDWVELVEGRTRTTPTWSGSWYPGRPVMVRTNDYRLRLFNGDIGVTVQTEDGLKVAFPDPGGIRLVGPGQLSSIEGVQAMTIHKSQGSQFKRVTVLVPGEDSRLLTRELLYTAVTRAENHVTVVGGEQAIRDAVERPVVRASGLRARLWDSD